MLFAACRPSAITGRIRAIIVDAIERCAHWSRTHVAEKYFEVLSPFIADRDPTSAPTLESSGVRVGASLNHASPRMIFTALWLMGVATVPVGHCWRCVSQHFTMNTATGTSATASQRRAAHGFYPSALTSNHPTKIVIQTMFALAKNERAAESFTSQIDQLHDYILPAFNDLKKHKP